APDGSLINTNYSFTMLNYLLPGQKSPFKIWFSDNWEDGDTYEIQVQGDYDETAPAQVVQIVNQQVTASDGICTVTGNAKNTGSTNLTYATVIAAFYDSQNTLLEAEWSFTDGDSLPAGASAAFTITSYSCPEYDHVEVFAGN
ncbi:MAG: FxLYD domain-containing protein, partial [Anaerolineaceae bacterium]